MQAYGYWKILTGIHMIYNPRWDFVYKNEIMIGFKI